MKILHSSDWHLGRTLYGRNRYQEFEAFLEWLIRLIQQESIDTLLIAGDVFDTGLPSNRAQTLYYQFLCSVTTTRCRHVVVIAGNHDSPTFLNAPKDLLKALNVHVIGSPTDNIQDEILVLRDVHNKPELIVCAVPFLRDKDIRHAQAGESIEDKEQKLLEGIRDHYSLIASMAAQQRLALAATIPIIGMGHLFTAGAQTMEGDGVRELYVGSLAHVNSSTFPTIFDYVALGHLHVPQIVGGLEHVRYCGSPIPMGFGEATQQKSVCTVEFNTAANQSITSSIQQINVPVFQSIQRIKGDWEKISQRITELKAMSSQVWLEIIYDGIDIISNLRDRVDTAIEGTAIEVLRIKNTRLIDRVLTQIDDQESLDDLDVLQVFDRCLTTKNIAEHQREELLQAYQETLTSLYQEDTLAE